jgi:hypothetical protein
LSLFLLLRNFHVQIPAFLVIMSRIAPESEGLQYAGVNYDSSPEALPYQPPQPQYYPLPMYKVEEHEEPYVAPAPSPPVTICGMRRNYFFFLAALAGFIVVAGAVVGGVVGSRQSSNSSVRYDTRSKSTCALK